MKNVSIKHLQLFEDRSDAACRVVLKPRAHAARHAGRHGTRMKAAAMGDLWARCGSQCRPRKRPTVGAGSSRFSRRFPRPFAPPYARILSDASPPRGGGPHGHVGAGGLCSDAACHGAIQGGAEGAIVAARCGAFRVSAAVFVAPWRATAHLGVPHRTTKHRMMGRPASLKKLYAIRTAIPIVKNRNFGKLHNKFATHFVFMMSFPLTPRILFILLGRYFGCCTINL